jgi:hypothetical protein
MKNLPHGVWNSADRVLRKSRRIGRNLGWSLEQQLKKALLFAREPDRAGDL